MTLRELVRGKDALYLGAGALAFAGLGALLGYAWGKRSVALTISSGCAVPPSGVVHVPNRNPRLASATVPKSRRVM